MSSAPDSREPAPVKAGRPSPVVEVAVLVLVFLLFTRLHAAAGRDVVASATANALALQSIERALHMAIELPANQWLAGQPVLSQLAVYYYRLYYVVVVGVLVWTFVRHPAVYTTVRRTLVAMTFLVLPVFWALPMSPPRFALPGVVDIVAAHDILGSHTTQRGGGQNLYSAMPSMHVAWSLWCAFAVWYALRATRPRLAVLAWVFPLGMTAVVLTTGNHYVLDIVGSVTLLVVAVAAAAVWGHVVDRWRMPRSRISAPERSLPEP